MTRLGNAAARAAVTVALALLPSAAGAAPLPEPVFEALRGALEVYEAARAELAADRLEGLPAAASRLAGTFELAGRTGKEDLAADVAAVIQAAETSAEVLAEAADLEAARAAFGEVSRALVLLAEVDSRLVEGWHVFACPMVETFAKWLQKEATMANPYMGTAMLQCGFESDWTVPRPAAATPALAQDERRDEPEFEPGIPGLKMVDVRDQKFLWREIDELQSWERGGRLTVAEFRGKAIEKTVHYLELRGAAAEAFTAAATEAVTSVRASFDRRVGGPTGAREERLSADLGDATARLLSLLGDAPRHQLFAPEAKRWLLRLAFGPREAKEAREAEVAEAATARNR